MTLYSSVRERRPRLVRALRGATFVLLVLFSLFNLLSIIAGFFPSLMLVAPNGAIPVPQPYVFGNSFYTTISYLLSHGFPAWNSIHTVKSFGYDFAFFYYAFHNVWFYGGTQLYDIAQQRVWMHSLGLPLLRANQYVYPPQFAVLLAPLALLPFRTAALVWTAAALSGIILSGVFLSVTVFAHQRAPVRRLLLISVILGYYGVFDDLAIANSNWFILLLLSTFFLILYRFKQPWLAGLPLGLAMLFKVTPVMILLYFLLRREWKLLFATLMTVGTASLFTGIVVGWSPIWYYVTHLGALSRHSMENGPVPYNISIVGLLQLYRSFRTAPMSQGIVVTLFAIYVIGIATAIFFTLRRHNNWRLDMAMSAITVVAFSPLVEATHTVVLLITFAALFSLVGRQDELRQSIAVSSHPAWINAVPVALLFLLMAETSRGLMLLISNYLLPYWWPFAWIFWQPFTFYATILVTFAWVWMRSQRHVS